MHPDVSTTVSAYLKAVDTALPGLVAALYIGGSVPLGDFQPHESDIDFFAVTTRRPDTDALAEVHASLGRALPQPHFDGLYVTWEELAAGPVAHHTGPHAFQHRFAASGGFERNPVAWHILASHGMTVRGPAVSDVDVWTDDSALLDYCRTNLDTYWRPQHQEIHRQLAAATVGDDAAMRFAAAYCVLGVPRLHYTLTTGETTTKTGAGEYARQVWPHWTPVIDECLRFRAAQPTGHAYPDTTALLADALDFTAHVIDNACALRAPVPSM